MRRIEILKSEKYPQELLELYSNNYPYAIMVHAYRVIDIDDDEIVKCINSINPFGLIEAISSLTVREQIVLERRFKHNMTLDDTAASFNVTCERIRQIERKALRKLRHPERRRQYESVLKADYTGLLEKYNQLLNKDDKLDTLVSNNTIIPESDFSVRAFNCLKRCGLVESRSIKNLPEITLGELYAVRNLGLISLYEVYSKIKEKLGINLANNKVKLGTDGNPYFQYPNGYLYKHNCASDDYVINQLNNLASVRGWDLIERGDNNEDRV